MEVDVEAVEGRGGAAGVEVVVVEVRGGECHLQGGKEETGKDRGKVSASGGRQRIVR